MEDATAILTYLREQKEEMVRFVTRLVQAESPTTAPTRQEPVQRMLADALVPLGFAVRLFPGEKSGGTLYAEPEGAGGGQRQLLLGHSDTVWPVGTLARMPVQRDGDVLRGPGVYDMKAGLTQIIFALRALQKIGALPVVAPVVLVNSDEETGSHESEEHIVRVARQSARAFVLEPSLGPEGRLKTARKGVGYYRVVTEGRAAHAGLDPEKGRSAILGMARLVQRLEALTDHAAGVTVNVGTIQGGVRSNVVAPRCEAEVDVRVPTRSAGERLDAAVHQIATSGSGVQGVSVKIEGGINRFPLERTPRNRELWEVAQRCGAALGLMLAEGRAGGGSDGNITSQFTATLDGLGAVGDGAHADDEHIRIEKMVERTALLALLLLVPPQV